MGKEWSRLMSEGTYAIAFYEGMPKLVEVVAITGKRARIRRPDAPATAEVRSLPIAELYEYDEAKWAELDTCNNRILRNKSKIEEISRTLNLFITSLKQKAGGVGDDFWS